MSLTLSPKSTNVINFSTRDVQAAVSVDRLKLKGVCRTIAYMIASRVGVLKDQPQGNSRVIFAPFALVERKMVTQYAIKIMQPPCCEDEYGIVREICVEGFRRSFLNTNHYIESMMAWILDDLVETKLARLYRSNNGSNVRYYIGFEFPGQYEGTIQTPWFAFDRNVREMDL